MFWRQDMWDFTPQAGIEPSPPTLEGVALTTELPGNTPSHSLFTLIFCTLFHEGSVVSQVFFCSLTLDLSCSVGAFSLLGSLGRKSVVFHGAGGLALKVGREGLGRH